MTVPNLTLRQLEVLVAIVDRGSFAAAADHFGLAQPSISGHVRAIERHTGGAVFERTRGRRAVLTPLGRSVVAHAREMIDTATDLGNDVLSNRTTAGERVVFACQRSLANFLLAKPISAFALARPASHLVVRVGKQEDVVADVREGAADVGCYLSNDERRGLTSEVIGRQRLILVAAPGHPLAGRRVRPSDLARHAFVGPPPTSMFGRAVAKLLAGAGVPGVRTVAQTTEYQFLRELVAAGIGVSCSAARSVEADVAKGLLVPLDFAGPDLWLDIRIVTAVHRRLAMPALDLCQFLRDSVRDDDPALAPAIPDPQVPIGP
jgi:DNA-binding transcriptional LysR family regulator